MEKISEKIGLYLSRTIFRFFKYFLVLFQNLKSFFFISKTSNSEVVGTIVIQDYTTNENIKLAKGQTVNFLQKLNNENCLIQLITDQQQIDLIVPTNIIKLQKSKVILQTQSSSSSSSQQQVLNEDFYSKNLKLLRFSSNIVILYFKDELNSNNDEQSSSKRKGSFKKWLRASHRKLTTTTTAINNVNRNNNVKVDKSTNNNKVYLMNVSFNNSFNNSFWLKKRRY